MACSLYITASCNYRSSSPTYDDFPDPHRSIVQSAQTNATANCYSGTPVMGTNEKVVLESNRLKFVCMDEKRTLGRGTTQVVVPRCLD